VVLGYIVDFSIYSVLIQFGVSLFLSNTVAFFIGVTINTILIRRFVFSDSRFSFLSDLKLSLISNGMMFGVGMAVLWGLVRILAIDPYFAKIITNGFTFFVNYLIRIVFFRKK
jgi:putative flippase GtrA